MSEDNGPEQRIPVKDWIPWVPHDGPGDREPVYRKDLTPAQRTEFDAWLAEQRKVKKQKPKAKAKPDAKPKPGG